MLIYVCVSTHGYGHAARQAAVLIQLHRLQPDWQLVISSSVDETFLALVLRHVPVSRRTVRWDVGMLQADALGVDQQATLQALQQVEKELPQRLQREVDWIREQDSQCVVLADIPPAAAQLARRLDAPLVWMGNFGWDEIYQPLGAPFEPWADAALAGYQRGQLLLRCPFDLRMDWGLKEQALGLVCTTPRPLASDWERAMRSLDRTLVLVGFGGLGLQLDPELFLRWPNHHFLMASPAQATQVPALQQVPNLTLLPGSVRPIDAFPLCSRQLGLSLIHI